MVTLAVFYWRFGWVNGSHPWYPEAMTTTEDELLNAMREAARNAGEAMRHGNGVTVAELIAELSLLPQNLPVAVYENRTPVLLVNHERRTTTELIGEGFPSIPDWPQLPFVLIC